MVPAWLRETAEGVTVRLRVQPRAAANRLAGIQGGELKVHLTSPPVDGAANKLCREYFARLLGVAKSRVRLARGEKSRHKQLMVEGITVQQVRAALEPRLG